LKKLTAEEKLERRMLRKTAKKDGNRVGFGLLWYFLITLITAIVWLIAEMEIAVQSSGVTDPAEAEKIMDTVTENSTGSAWSMIAGVLLGVGFLFLFFRKQGAHRRLFHREESMTLGKFVGAACVFLGVQLIFNGVYYLMEAGLNLIGYTAEASKEMATADSTTLSMFLYAGIIGPIVEELIYRGLVFRVLEKHGTNLAIVVSSLLFGIMHGNIPQAMFAFLTGIILCYVASRYSLWWCIALHILNNLVLGDLFTKAISGLSENLQEIISYGVMGAFTIAGLIVLFRKRKDIIAFFRQHKTEKPRMRWILTCPGIMIFILINLALGVSMLEKL